MPPGTRCAGHRAAPELGARAVGVPRPIPGGIQPLGPGIEVFHLFPPGTSEPDTITDFDSLAGVGKIDGHLLSPASGMGPVARHDLGTT